MASFLDPDTLLVNDPQYLPLPEITLAARELVQKRFDQSSGLIDEYDAISNTYLTSLIASLPDDMIYPLYAQAWSIDLPVEEVPPLQGDRPPTPQREDFVSVIEDVVMTPYGEMAAALGLVEVAVDDVTIPLFDISPITVTLPAAPTDLPPTIDDTAPALDDVSLPAVPDITLPSVPVLETITLPATPEISFLDFDGTMPTEDLTPPDKSFLYLEVAYQSDVEQKIRYRLTDGIDNGGTGINAEAEEAFWARMLERLDYELEKTYWAVMDLWGAQGFEMPDGILAAQLREVMSESDRRKQDGARDVAYKQAELAHEYTKFLVTSGLQFEKQMMDYANSVAQRAFDTAKAELELTVTLYNARVEAYKAQLDGYKTQASVYESRIRAELAKVEVYKAQLEGAKILGDLQVQRVEIYSKQVSALQTLIDIYRAQMEGAKIQLEVNRTRLEAFRTVIDAKKAQIEAVTARYNLYQAQLNGETAKVEMYGKQVDAYAQRVNAVKVESEINFTQANADIEANKNKVEVLRAAIEQYKADVDYQTAREDAAVKAYTAEVGAYEADVKREEGYDQNAVEIFKAEVQQASSRIDALIKQAENQLRSVTALKEMQVEATKAVANITAQKTASALSAVSASAQLGYNEAVSLGGNLSNSYQSSDSLSRSYQESKSQSAARNDGVTYSVSITGEDESPSTERVETEPEVL